MMVSYSASETFGRGLKHRAPAQNFPHRGSCFQVIKSSFRTFPSDKFLSLRGKYNSRDIVRSVQMEQTARRLHSLVDGGRDGGGVLGHVGQRGARVPREEHEHVDGDAQQDRHPVPEQPAAEHTRGIWCQRITRQPNTEPTSSNKFTGDIKTTTNARNLNGLRHFETSFVAWYGEGKEGKWPSNPGSHVHTSTHTHTHTHTHTVPQ